MPYVVSSFTLSAEAVETVFHLSVYFKRSLELFLGYLRCFGAFDFGYGYFTSWRWDGISFLLGICFTSARCRLFWVITWSYFGIVPNNLGQTCCFIIFVYLGVHIRLNPKWFLLIAWSYLSPRRILRFLCLNIKCWFSFLLHFNRRWLKPSLFNTMIENCTLGRWYSWLYLFSLQAIILSFREININLMWKDLFNMSIFNLLTLSGW